MKGGCECVAEPSTYIKLDRNILNWGWFKNPITTHVFIYLLLKANIKTGHFLGVEIKRGQVATSYATIASDCGITYKQARNAVTKLSSKNGQSQEGADGQSEITVRRHSQFIVVTIENYEKYQGSKPKVGNQMGNQMGSQRAISRANTGQQSKNIKNKENGRFPNGETAEERKKRLEELRNQ